MLDIISYKAEVYSDLIERIWIAENKEESMDLMVPPNQYVSIIFPLNNSKYTCNGRVIQSPQIEGLTLQTSCLHYPKGCKVLGIRFYPYGLHSFVNINGKELINNNLDLMPFLNASIDLNDGTKEELFNDIYTLLNKLFNKKNYEKTIAVRDYYQYFRGEQAMLSIEEYCKKHNTNYTSLNRLFSRVIGLSPKRFERLIKFRKSLCNLIDSSENLTNISVESGYFDQAHFIREFKIFLNNTPSAYQSLIKSADKESNIINYNFRLF